MLKPTPTECYRPSTTIGHECPPPGAHLSARPPYASKAPEGTTRGTRRVSQQTFICGSDSARLSQNAPMGRETASASKPHDWEQL
ncbi:hypothetical protein niasHS_009330 [Heterodera schachtii]|uniref:Uncharacterized protein n=1 Tax=Heterodera schachtii TaxID=97005 RepID=A0ABD2JBX9_HETSC